MTIIGVMLESGANITKQIFYLMKKNKKIFFLTVGRSDFLRQKSIFDNITKEKKYRLWSNNIRVSSSWRIW